eukprot:8277383-Pyramimonas_sp.AAC.1
MCIRDSEECAPGQLFRPRCLPQEIWMQLHGFMESSIYKEVAEVLLQSAEGADDDGAAQARARSSLVFRPCEQELTRRSSGPRVARRSGFTPTHAPYLTSTLSR